MKALKKCMEKKYKYIKAIYIVINNGQGRY
jgi:hypothetical protein